MINKSWMITTDKALWIGRLGNFGFSSLFLPYYGKVVISKLWLVEETGVPGENYRLSPNHPNRRSQVSIAFACDQVQITSLQNQILTVRMINKSGMITTDKALWIGRLGNFVFLSLFLPYYGKVVISLWLVEETGVPGETTAYPQVIGNFLTCPCRRNTNPVSGERRPLVSGNTLDHTAIGAGP